MEEKFLVIVNKSFENETIHYCGDSEVEAYKIFKGLNNKMRELVRAKVKMVKIYGYDFIDRYEIIEKIN